MIEDRNDAGALRPRRALAYVLGMTLLSALVASWFVWGPLGVVFYIDGLFNSDWVFMLGPLLFLLIPAAAVFLPVQTVRLVRRWHRLTLEHRWRQAGLVVVMAGFAGSFALGYARVLPIPTPVDMFARGFAQHVRSKTSIDVIQDWLSTLDPNDCQDQPLDVKVAPGVHLAYPPRLIPTPPAIACLHPRGTRLERDSAGRPLVRLIWGGGLMGHRGLTVGSRDMPVPPPDPSGEGEYRVPLAPGAYFWSGD